MTSKRQLKRKLGYVLQFDVNPACVANVKNVAKNEERDSKTAGKMAQVQEQGKNRESRAAKTELPFLGLSLLWNRKETLATQANVNQTSATCVPVNDRGGGGYCHIWAHSMGSWILMGYIGMCCCEGYGFQAVSSGIGYINQRVGSRIGYHFPGDWSIGWRY